MTYLDDLFRLAQDISPVANARVCSCLVKRGRIISYGFCQYKTHPKQQEFGGVLKPYLHSEIDCLIKASRRLGTEDLSGTSLYTCRIKRPSTWSKDWVMGLAAPCLACQKAIEYYKVGDYCYSC